MRILNTLTITSDDKNIPNNPLGLESFFGQSSALLSNFLFTTDSFQTYVDSNITKNENVWFNGEAFPFLVKEINKNYALSITNSYISINAYSTASNILFGYQSTGTNSISIDDNGLLTLDSTNNFGEFILNDYSSNYGNILTSNKGYAYWGTPGFTQSNYYDNTDIGGLSNLRTYSAKFNFTTNLISSLTYSTQVGYPYTRAFGVDSGLSYSNGNGYNNIDVYHNLSNTYSITTFWAYTASVWKLLYPDIGLTGVCGTFSYYSYGNKTTISLTGSLPTVIIQVNVLG